MRRYRLHLTAGKGGLVVVPRHVRLPRVNAHHRDAVIHGADDGAEVAADTFFLFDLRNRLARHAAGAKTITIGADQGDGLVCAVLARDVAKIAADALVVVDGGDALVMQVEPLPLLQRGHGFADEFAHALHALSVEVIVQTVGHVLHDAKTMVHDRRANLHARRAERDELRRIPPGRDAADAGDRNPDLGIRRAALNHVQGNRLHRRAAVPAVRAPSADEWLGAEVVEVDLRDAVDGVDERNRVALRPAGRPRGRSDVRDVGRELGDDRDFRDLLDPPNDGLGHLRILADGRAHAALAHAVRTAEVQFDAVRPRVLGALYEFMPALAGVHHERRDDGVPRPALLDLGKLAEIRLRRAVGDELDVVKPDHAGLSQVERRIARGDVHDGIADGLPNHAAPAGLERAVRLISRVGGRAAGDPEWIG